MPINYSGNLYNHCDTNHAFQKYSFELLAYLANANKFLGCFKVCITLHLSNTFFNLLSFTLLNNELAVIEILFESKLLF